MFLVDNTGMIYWLVVTGTFPFHFHGHCSFYHLPMFTSHFHVHFLFKTVASIAILRLLSRRVRNGYLKTVGHCSTPDLKCTSFQMSDPAVLQVLQFFSLYCKSLGHQWSLPLASLGILHAAVPVRRSGAAGLGIHQELGHGCTTWLKSRRCAGRCWWKMMKECSGIITEKWLTNF